MGLDGKVILITGAGGGLGRAMALAFAQRGARVIVNDIQAERARGTAEFATQVGPPALVDYSDVSNSDAVQALFARLRREIPPLQVLVNNVGIGRPGSLGSLTEAEGPGEAAILRSVFALPRSPRAQKRQRWGRIINISSMLAFHGGPFEISYATSKGAVNAMTKSLAREVARFGITVNAVCPALVETNLSREYVQDLGWFGEASRDLFRTLCPIPRDLQPQDVAELVVFLASEEAGYVNGQLLKLDGGAL
jgi:NAD(P)-dependent dehydrogenase (short-subunit alcohol dehydrogenase family)